MRTFQLSALIAITFLLGACGENQEKEDKNGEKEVAKDTIQEDKIEPHKILFVVTSHSKLGDTGDSTGFYLSEAAHPWHVLKEEYVVDFVSPKGGRAPVDGVKLKDSINNEFWNNDSMRYKINHTLQPSQINPEEYLAIHYVGGHGTMWDFPSNQKLAKIAAQIYENGGVVSAVCHGPAGLLNIRLSNTQYLIKGKEVTGFTNEEEAAVELTEVVPFLLENQLRSRKAKYSKKEKFTPHVVVDQRVITGQNPQSATGVGEAIQKELRKIKKAK